MHSFHPSRGRIVFEVFCALGIAASLVGAWLQTGASALLGASVAAALFGISHAFGTRRGPAIIAEPQRIALPGEGRDALVADLRPLELVAIEQPDRGAIFETAGTVAPASAPPKRTRKAKTPRKSESRRSKVGEEAAIEVSAPPAETDAAMPMLLEEDHPRIEPLFEPEPFVRQPRAVVFGRKAG